MIAEWPLFHDTREEAEACPACGGTTFVPPLADPADGDVDELGDAAGGEPDHQP